MARKGTGWIRRRGNTATCRSCGKDVMSLPSSTCEEPRHSAYRKAREPKLAAGNARRTESRWRGRLLVMRALGGKCVACGIRDVRVLQINHRNGGGTRERLEAGLSGSKLVRDLLNGRRRLDDLDLRCANCNILFEYECGRRADPKVLRAPSDLFPANGSPVDHKGETGKC